MDLNSIIHELRKELATLDNAIAIIERLERPINAPVESQPVRPAKNGTNNSDGR